MLYVVLNLCFDVGTYVFVHGWRDVWGMEGWMGMDGRTDIVVLKVPFASAIQRPTGRWDYLKIPYLTLGKENRSSSRNEEKPKIEVSVIQCQLTTSLPWYSFLKVP